MLKESLSDFIELFSFWEELYLIDPLEGWGAGGVKLTSAVHHPEAAEHEV